MKYLVPAVLILLLASCTGRKNEHEQKIKQCITTYLIACGERKDMANIDSIGLSSVDTLTEKSCLKIDLDRSNIRLKELSTIYEAKSLLFRSDSAFLHTLKDQKEQFAKHKERYDESQLKELIAKVTDDSLQLIANVVDIQKTKKSIDSITLLYAKADSISFHSYYISANIYLDKAPEEQGNFIISKDWNVRR
jgi:hypothetical protein